MSLIMPAEDVNTCMKCIHNSAMMLVVVIMYQPSEETLASHSGVGATNLYIYGYMYAMFRGNCSHDFTEELWIQQVLTTQNFL